MATKVATGGSVSSPTTGGAIQYGGGSLASAKNCPTGVITALNVVQLPPLVPGSASVNKPDASTLLSIATLEVNPQPGCIAYQPSINFCDNSGVIIGNIMFWNLNDFTLASSVTASITNTSTSVTGISPAQPLGQYNVQGTGIPGGAILTVTGSGTTGTLSTGATATNASVTLTLSKNDSRSFIFPYLPPTPRDPQPAPSNNVGLHVLPTGGAVLVISFSLYCWPVPTINPILGGLQDF